MARGVAKRPRDSPSLFCRELGLTTDEPKWAQIKQAVRDILVHRDLVGRPPSSIRDHAIKTAMAEQLEAIHLATFSPLKPSTYRRDLVHRIFAYQMMRLRGEVRRKGGEGGQQVTPLQPGTPSTQTTPSKQATPSKRAASSKQATPKLSTPAVAESPAAEPSMTETIPVGPPPRESPTTEHSQAEPPAVVGGTRPIGSPVMGSRPARSPVVEPRTVASPAVGFHSNETPVEMEVEPTAPTAPKSPATGPLAPGLQVMEPLSMQTLSAVPRTVFVPVPVLNWHKEVVVTILVPSAPGFLAKFTKSHLLQGSDFSMARFFEILGEEGFRGEPVDYVVRDEFNDRLVSQRHLTVAFQLLANEEKLATTWRVLKKIEDEERSPRPGLLFNPQAPPVATPNVSGSSETGSPAGGPSSKSDIVETGCPSDAPVLPESPQMEVCETQDHADSVEKPQPPNRPKVKKKSFLDISDSGSDSDSGSNYSSPVVRPAVVLREKNQARSNARNGNLL